MTQLVSADARAASPDIAATRPSILPEGFEQCRDGLDAWPDLMARGNDDHQVRDADRVEGALEPAQQIDSSGSSGG
jgi:hypothetical protein